MEFEIGELGGPMWRYRVPDGTKITPLEAAKKAEIDLKDSRRGTNKVAYTRGERLAEDYHIKNGDAILMICEPWGDGGHHQRNNKTEVK